VLRRMGRSYLEYAVDPFILGVYAGDPSTLVPRYALPKLYRLEQEFGSFIGGAIRKKFIKKTGPEQKATREVFSVKGGLQNLTDALCRETGMESFRLGCREIKAEPEREGFRVSFDQPGTGKMIVHTNHVIVTTGSNSLPGLVPGIQPADMEQLTNLRYARVIEVALGFKKWEGMEPDGFGGLIPFREQRDLLGILFPSAFLEGRAPVGGALFTIFIGGIRRSELFDLNDKEIQSIVKREFCDLMGLDRFVPDLFRIFRYKHAIPQYESNSGIRFGTVEKIEKEIPGLFLRGNFQGGIGLADRIRQGRLVAEEVMRTGISE
jgi:protoporphyrinogen/coproporphyrinogen III oxidase